ncbi:MAG: SUMF1/EgtB/PvdO family nonheme iron enzyme, partial [Myxococcota bacterium]
MKILLLALTIATTVAGCASPDPLPQRLIFEVGKYEHDQITGKMRLVEAGSFQMGEETFMLDERPLHTVTVSSYYIAETEVTQEEWLSVMGNYPSVQLHRDFPVENITWFDAISFVNRLSAQQGLTPVYSVEGDAIVWDRS